MSFTNTLNISEYFIWVANCERLMSKDNEKSDLLLDVHATALIANLLYLMTCYSQKNDKSLVEPIQESLDWLSLHPIVLNSQLNDICKELKRRWSTITLSKTASAKSLH